MRHKVSDLQPTGRNVKVTVKRILEESKTKIGENENRLLSEKLIYIRLNFSKIAAMILLGKDICFALKLSFRKLSVSENRKRRDNE